MSNFKRIAAAVLVALLSVGAVAATADTADAANGLKIVAKANGLKANGL